MQTINHVVRYAPPESFRLAQVRGMFDYSAKETERKWQVEIPSLEDQWQIGLIVGPSGSGKSQIANKAFGNLGHKKEWSGLPLIDEFPKQMSVKEICDLLTRVGLSSTPAWTIPYSCLSTGQKFRADIAMALAEVPADQPIIIDEFTSTVDRTVAQTTSSVVAGVIRKGGRRLVAIACHYDIIDWLNPCWILNMADQSLTRRSERRRPQINLKISKSSQSAWRLFMDHHYLSHDLSSRSTNYMATINDVPAAFISIINYPSTKYGLTNRVHRIVVLPDFQGLGIAQSLLREVCGRLSLICYLSTSHAPFARSLAKSPHWRLIRQPSINKSLTKKSTVTAIRTNTLLASFQYVGPKYPRHATDQIGLNETGAR